MTGDLEILRELVKLVDDHCLDQDTTTGLLLGNALHNARPALSRLLARLVDAEKLADVQRQRIATLEDAVNNNTEVALLETARAHMANSHVKALEAKLAGAMAVVDAAREVSEARGKLFIVSVNGEAAVDALSAALASMTQADTIVGEGEHGKRE